MERGRFSDLSREERIMSLLMEGPEPTKMSDAIVCKDVHKWYEKKSSTLKYPSVVEN